MEPHPTDRDAAPRAVLLATLAVVLAAFCWGLNAVIAKGAFEAGIPPARLAEARTLVGGAPLIAYLALRRRDLLIPPRSAIGPIIVFGLGLVAINFAFYTAIDRVPVGVALSLQYTAPAAGVASAIFFAVYLLSAQAAARRGAHPATVLAGAFAVASVAWGIILPWWSWPVDRLAEPEIVLRVLGVGLLGTLFPFLLVVNALRLLPAAVAGIAATTEPVFATGLAWLLLNQSLGAAQLAGGGLVVSGVVLAQLGRR